MASAASAQKRNNLKLIGFGFDYMVKTSSIFDNDYDVDVKTQLALGHLFTWGFGYERVLGNHVVLGVNYWKYFETISNDINFNSRTQQINGRSQSVINYQPIQVNNHVFRNAVFSQSGFQVGFESKFFFKSHTTDGANGFYLASSYQLAQLNYSFSNAQYQDTTNSSLYTTKTVDIPDATTFVSKLGLKMGVSASTYVSSDFFIAFNYVLPSDLNNKFVAPITTRNLGIAVGLQVGIPF